MQRGLFGSERWTTIEQLRGLFTGDILFVIAVLVVAWFTPRFVSFRYSINGKADDPAIATETKYLQAVLILIAGVSSGLAVSLPAVAAVGAGLIGYDFLAARYWESGPRALLLVALSLVGLVIGQLLRAGQL